MNFHPTKLAVVSLIAAGLGASPLAQVLGFFAVATATVNVVGGFLVTDRMLEMFKSRSERKRPER